MRLVVRKERGDERVNHRLADAVADGEQEHAPEQALKRGVFAPSREGRSSGKC